MHSNFDCSFKWKQRLIRLLLVPAFCCVAPLAADEAPAVTPAEAPADATADPIEAEADASPFGPDLPLITEQEIIDFRRDQAKYFNALRAAEPKSPTIQLVKNGLRVRVLSMSLPKYRDSISVLRKTLMRELKLYVGQRQTNPRLKQQFREVILDEIIVHCRALMTNNLVVRVQAATLIGDLNMVEEDRIAGTTAQPYDKAIVPLRDILTDAQQDISVKIVALNGIRRLLADTTLNYSGNEQLLTAKVLCDAVEPNTTFFWYQQSLIQAIGLTKVAADRDGKPFVAQALAQVMADNKRDPRVRCSAAFSVGRITLTSSVNLAALSYQVAALTREMLDAYNQNPTAVYWNQCFFDLYGSFQAVNQQEQAEKKGLLLAAEAEVFSQFKPNVTASFAQITPVVDKVFLNRARAPLPADVSAPLIKWLTENNPGEIIVFPGGRPISLAPPATNAAVTGR